MANSQVTSWRPAKGRFSSGGPSSGRFIQLIAGLVLLGLALPPFFSFPWLGFWLVPVAAIYLFLLAMLPRLWLVVLPLATVGLDITPFTGRFAYTELDLLFLVTLASGLLYNRYRFKVFAPRLASIILFLYLGVIALGYSGWEFFFLPPQAAQDNPYYTSEYTYKVLKGVVWGVGLVPLWGYLLAVNKQRSVDALVTGMSCAAVLLGLIILWERGTLGVIISGSAWYHIVSSLMDLTSSYRVTGIFSDMHTGGEALDGVVLLLFPVTLYGAIYGRAIWLRLLAAVGMMSLAYVTLVGFTRATYGAFAIGLLLYTVLTLLSRHRNRMPLPVSLSALAATLGAGLLAATLAFRYAGSYGLASYGALLLLAYSVNRWQLPAWGLHLVTALALVLVALAMNAHFGSRWAEPSYVIAVLTGVSLFASHVLARRLFGRVATASEFNRVFLLGGVLALTALIAVALGGYQINDRASRISGDLESREHHWRNVIDSTGSGLYRALLGNGVGRFPSYYIAGHPETVRSVGSFNVARDEKRDVLRMGGGEDLTLGQRVTIEPYTLYTVSIYIRAQQPARMVIGLCERNLIYASNFMPNCHHKSLSFPATDGMYRTQTVELNSERVGERRALLRWPTVMTIRYDQPDTVVEIDAIELSADGFNVLHNSSFKRGLDYWFFYNDFAHLPWHVKNTFMQVWFESGWLGLGLFLALLTLLVHRNFERHAYDSLVPVYTTAILTLCVFGLFGSPLDSARVSWMFYFFLAAGLAQLKVRARSRAGASTNGLAGQARSQPAGPGSPAH